MNPLVVVGGLLLLFFLPGFLLLVALFPNHRWFGPFHPFALPALSVALSAVILVLLGSVLGFLPGGVGGRGWFQGNQTGAPVIEATLAFWCLAFFAIAWQRGAFPLLMRNRALAPEVEPTGWRERGEPAEVTLLRDLRLEEDRLRREAIRVRARANESRDVGVQTALGAAADDLDRQRREVVGRVRDVERRASEKRTG